MGRLDELPQGKNLLFICAAGVRSGLACEFAMAGGFDPATLFNIEDGTPSWIAVGNPTSYGNDPLEGEPPQKSIETVIQNRHTVRWAVCAANGNLRSIFWLHNRQRETLKTYHWPGTA